MRVRRGSAIQISYNTYSVSVRLIGEYVEARIGVEEIEVWYADTLVYPFPLSVARHFRYTRPRSTAL